MTAGGGHFAVVAGPLRRLGTAMLGLGLVLSALSLRSAGPAGAGPLAPPPPSVAGWGFGLDPASQTGSVITVVPHPDDEGSLWAEALNSDSGAFPVYVTLTNGENAEACTTDRPILPAPAGNLGGADRPPFNTAGDLPGAPAGYLGSGRPPEFSGAQGDDPPVFPRDPSLDPVAGWAPLTAAGQFSGQPQGGPPVTEGFDGACRAARLASLTAMFSYMNAAVTRLSSRAQQAFFPALRPGQPPDGQVCFNSPMAENYVSRTGEFSTPDGSGSWVVAPTTSGVVSTKDPCAYYWVTATGDLFAFNLGDFSEGFKAPCASALSGDIKQGGPWPAGNNGYDSIGAYPDGTRPVPSGSCSIQLAPGQESYAVSPSDVIWAIQQVAGSPWLTGHLPVKEVDGAAWVNGFNPSSSAPQIGSIDVQANRPSISCLYRTGGGYSCDPSPRPPDTCQPYLHTSHVAVGLALRWNSPLPNVPTEMALCNGDPLASRTIGTSDPADGDRFWTQVYDYDGGPGWEAAAQAYGWLTGTGAFDPYGPVVDTCPGAAVLARLGQSEWSCAESLGAGSASGLNVPGDSVAGMTDIYPAAAGGGLTNPL